MVPCSVPVQSGVSFVNVPYRYNKEKLFKCARFAFNVEDPFESNLKFQILLNFKQPSR